jgi:ABC-type cobalt transport system substrate-binding protein
MRFQISNFKFQIFSIVFSLLFIHCSPYTVVFASEKWSGVDETVVEKYAKEHGREASEPLINTDQGDMLLFVFLLAGAIGGFAAGYYWRTLSEGKNMDLDIKNIKNQLMGNR